MVKSIEAFDIVFDQPDDDQDSAVFYAGAEVRGRLLVVLKEEKKINEILLEFKGTAKTYWTKHSGKSRRHFRQVEPYFCQQFNTKYTHAYGNNQERVLPAGKHEIPFSYKLPKYLPSSFEGEFGYVRYTCKALMERPWDHDLVCKRAFSVIGLEDLNSDETKAGEPVSVSETDFGVRHCFQHSGTVSVRLTLPKFGYAPGECIDVGVEVQNDSRVALRKVRLSLKQRIRYTAKDFHNNEHFKDVCKVLARRDTTRRVPPRGNDSWHCNDMTLDPVAPKLIKCTIIDINYSIEFESEPGVVLAVPLLVGTIPVIPKSDAGKRLTIGQQQQQSLQDESDTESGATKSKLLRVTVPSTIAGQLYPSLPAPSFEKCSSIEVDIREEGETIQYGQRKFTPKYACYRTLLPVAAAS